MEDRCRQDRLRVVYAPRIDRQLRREVILAVAPVALREMGEPTEAAKATVKMALEIENLLFAHDVEAMEPIRLPAGEEQS